MQVGSSASNGDKFKISLTVKDTSSGRWDTSYTLLVINGYTAPRVDVFSNFSESIKMIPGGQRGKVKLFGMLEWSSDTSNSMDVSIINTIKKGLNVTWSVEGLTDEQLGLMALTPLSTLLTKYSIDVNVETNRIYHNLVLSTSVLDTRDSYTFHLSIINDEQVLISRSSLKLLRNEPPTAGTFTVLPTVGTELNTLFHFTAALWTDEEMPLMYEYLYLLENERTILIHQASAYGDVSSYLPRGRDSREHQLTCRLHVYDALGAISTKDSIVTVTPISLANSLFSLEEAQYLSSRLSQLTSSALSASNNDDYMMNVLSNVGSSIVPSVCSLAPDCAALYRNECSDTPDTCGSCLAGYTGVSGDSNYLCQASPVEQTPTLSSMATSTCTSDSQCGLYEFCSNSTISGGACTPYSKTCVQDCSNRGICRFEYTASVATLSGPASCSVLERSCRASCVCKYGYEGSYCQYESLDMHQRRLLLQDVLQGFQALVDKNKNANSVDDNFIKSMLSSIAALPIEASLYTNSQVALMASVGKFVGQEALDNSLAYDDILGMERLLNIMNEFSLGDGYGGGYVDLALRSARQLTGTNNQSAVPTSSSTSIPTSAPTVADMEADRQQLLQLVGRIYAQDMVPGQEAIALTSSSIVSYTFYSPILTYTNGITASFAFVTADGVVGIRSSMDISPKLCVVRYPSYAHTSVADSSAVSSSSPSPPPMEIMRMESETLVGRSNMHISTASISAYPSSAYLADIVRLQLDDMSKCAREESAVMDNFCLTSHDIQYYDAVNITMSRRRVYTVLCDGTDYGARTFICPGSSESIILDCGTASGTCTCMSV